MDEIQTPTSGPGPAKGGLALVIKIVVGVAVIAVIGGGITLGARIWDPLWNPFRPEPEEVIEEMLTNIGEVKTLHFEIAMNIEMVDERLGSEMQMAIVLNGDSDITDLQNSKSDMGFDIAMTEGVNGIVSFNGESKTIGKISYFKLETINLPAELEAVFLVFGIDLSKIKGQWIKIDEEALEGLRIKTQEPELSEEEQAKLKEKLTKLFKEKKVYYFKEELSDEKINEEKVYHYLLALDREKIKEVIPELFEIITEFSGGKISEADEIGLTFITGGIAEVIDEFLEKIGEIDIEVWIDKKDELLYKVKMDKEIDANVFAESAKGKTTIKIDMEFSNFDEPVKIEAPENFIEFEEIFLMMPFLQTGLPEGVPGIYLLMPEEMLPGYSETGYPYEPLFMQENNSLLQASILGIFSAILMK